MDYYTLYDSTPELYYFRIYLGTPPVYHYLIKMYPFVDKSIMTRVCVCFVELKNHFVALVFHINNQEEDIISNNDKANGGDIQNSLPLPFLSFSLGPKGNRKWEYGK